MHKRECGWHMKSRRTLTRHCKNSKEQSKAGAERNRGWARTRGKETNKKGKKRERQRERERERGRDGWGQRLFQSSIFLSPSLTTAADADRRSPLCFLTSLLWLGLFSAALRQGVENKHHTALSLSLSFSSPPSSLLSPTLSHSPRASMPYFPCCLWSGTLSSLHLLWHCMNETKSTQMQDSPIFLYLFHINLLAFAVIDWLLLIFCFISGGRSLHSGVVTCKHVWCSLARPCPPPLVCFCGSNWSVSSLSSHVSCCYYC